MTATEVLLTLAIVPVPCGECGVVFGMTEDYQEQRKKDGKSWYCPNGHSRVYRETEADRLRKQLARAEQERDRARANATHYRDQADAEERAHRATKGQVTKLRKRIANGVCPCCKRTFANLGRHIAGQHPDYGKDPTP